MVVYKCLLLFNSSNPLVILEIASNAFKMQPCIFCVFRSLDLVFDWSISLQISGLQFLIFKEIKFLDLRCFFQFFDQFFLTYIIYYTSQFFSYWWTCFFTALKSLVISLMRSSSSHSSGSESSSIFVKFTFLEFYLDTIYSSKSEPPYNDRSPSTGE